MPSRRMTFRARYASRDERRRIDRIEPLPAASAHEVVVLDQRQQQGNIRGIVLKIAVKRGNQLAPGMAKARGKGRGLPVIPVKMDHPDLGGVQADLIQQRGTAVRAAVIHVQNFKRGAAQTAPGLPGPSSVDWSTAEGCPAHP